MQHPVRHKCHEEQDPRQHRIFRRYHQQQTPLESTYQQQHWHRKQVDQLPLENHAQMPTRPQIQGLDNFGAPQDWVLLLSLGTSSPEVHQSTSPEAVPTPPACSERLRLRISPRNNKGLERSSLGLRGSRVARHIQASTPPTPTVNLIGLPPFIYCIYVLILSRSHRHTCSWSSTK